MTNDNHTISVVVFCYNQKDLISRAIDSVLSQTLLPNEIIIADDCSTDGSQQVLKTYQAKHPNLIKLILHPKNLGIAKNKNSGLKAATCEWVTYLDGDDYYLPGKLEGELKVAIEQNCDVVFSNFRLINQERNFSFDWVYTQKHSLDNLHYDLYQHLLPKPYSYRFELINQKVFKQIGYYHEQFNCYEDEDFRLRYLVFAKPGHSNVIGSVYCEASTGAAASQMGNKKFISTMINVWAKNWVAFKNKYPQNATLTYTILLHFEIILKNALGKNSFVKKILFLLPYLSKPETHFISKSILFFVLKKRLKLAR